MSDLRELLDYFNGRLEEEAKSRTNHIIVDKDKLFELIISVGLLKAVPAGRRA